MKQICRFDSMPSTINDGGYKRGLWVVWLNLSVSEIDPEDGGSERFQSVTERLVLQDKSINAFIDSVDPSHIAEASVDELTSIMKHFHAENDVEAWKRILKVQISGYDSSSHVNRFYLNGIQLWLDKQTRVGLVNSVTIEKNANRTTTCLWYGNYNIVVNVDIALECLSQLELYALSCFNVTAKHLAEVEQINSVEELMSYNIRAGYPEVLTLTTK